MTSGTPRATDPTMTPRGTEEDEMTVCVCGQKEKEKECECGCGCKAPATTRNDGGRPSCEACEEYVADEHGEVICSRQMESCPAGEGHDWQGGRIQTAQPGTPNWLEERCARCGAQKRSEDRGGWVVVNYTAGE